MTGHRAVDELRRDQLPRGLPHARGRVDGIFHGPLAGLQRDPSQDSLRDDDVRVQGERRRRENPRPALVELRPAAPRQRIYCLRAAHRRLLPHRGLRRRRPAVPHEALRGDDQGRRGGVVLRRVILPLPFQNSRVLVLYKSSESPSKSSLLLYIDTEKSFKVVE